MQNNRLLLGICIFITAISSYAQSVLPKMKITNQQNANPMELQELHTDIYVVGQTAITTMEMVFYNPNNRVMEGEFEFPLGAGQVVSRFALDINGNLREGVVVDKKQGRVAFENIVRRGVDPGLLEKTEGNNFKARVYPIPAKGSRRILIAFEQELIHRNGKDFYFLPIKGDFTLKKFSLKAEVVSREVKTEDDSVELSFKNWRNSYISELTKTDYRPNKNIALVFPKIEKQQIFASTENEKTYFYGSILPEKGIINNKSFPKKNWITLGYFSFK
ncbi:VIT domain-containing protein [Capnocytophaga cynodegmi]|uniref:VIT domain-containing protein n=1 Tax=Capnocytophaga cynodegmi TaxID=28189 RepID=UPI00385E314E